MLCNLPFTQTSNKPIEIGSEDDSYDAGVELEEVSREPQQIEYRKNLTSKQTSKQIDNTRRYQQSEPNNYIAHRYRHRSVAGDRRRTFFIHS